MPTSYEAPKQALAALEGVEPSIWQWERDGKVGFYTENPEQFGIDLQSPNYKWTLHYTTPPAALAISEAAIDEYLDGYTFEGDEGSYTPTEFELFVIKDAIMGLIAEPPASPAPAVQPSPLQRLTTANEAAGLDYENTAPVVDEREALDAKRYRWLRDDRNHFDGGLVVAQSEGEDVLWNKQLDATIDAAMAQKGQTK